MKTAIITAVAALGFAAPAFAENVDGDAIVMTRNAPAEAVFGPADSGLKLSSVSVTFGEQIVQELNVSDSPAVNGSVTAYVFDGAAGTGNNDFVAY